MNETATAGDNGTNEARAARRAQWAGHVQAQASSGKTIPGYCNEQGLKVWQFHYWRGALRAKAARSEGGFVELPRPEPAGRVGVQIGDVRVWVEPGFDTETLRAVVGALRTP